MNSHKQILSRRKTGYFSLKFTDYWSLIYSCNPSSDCILDCNLNLGDFSWVFYLFDIWKFLYEIIWLEKTSKFI